MGGNDVRDLAQTGSDPVPQAEAYEELQDAADELFEELRPADRDRRANILSLPASPTSA